MSLRGQLMLGILGSTLLSLLGAVLLVGWLLTSLIQNRYESELKHLIAFVDSSYAVRLEAAKETAANIASDNSLRILTRYADWMQPQLEQFADSTLNRLTHAVALLLLDKQGHVLVQRGCAHDVICQPLNDLTPAQSTATFEVIYLDSGQKLTLRAIAPVNFVSGNDRYVGNLVLYFDPAVLGRLQYLDFGFGLYLNGNAVLHSRQNQPKMSADKYKNLLRNSWSQEVCPLAEGHITYYRTIYDHQNQAIALFGVRISTLDLQNTLRWTIFAVLATLLIFGILGIVTSMLICQHAVITPLARLQYAANQLAANLSTRIEWHDDSELGQLAQTFNIMAGQLEQAFRVMQETQKHCRAQLERYVDDNEGGRHG